MRTIVFTISMILVLASVAHSRSPSESNGFDRNKQPVIPVVPEEEEETGASSGTSYTYTPPVVRDRVTRPDGSTVWVHGRSGMTVEWTGLEGQYRKVELWKSGSFVDELSGWLENADHFTLPGSVSSDWGSGTDFQVRVYDNLDNEVWSDDFQISSTVQVTEPGVFTSWYSGMTGAQIEWSGCQGEQVSCELYRNSEYVADISGPVNNNGSYILTRPVPSSWGTGDGYSVRVMDSNGNTGISTSFDICGIQVAPFPSDTLPDVIQWTGGNVVARVELYSGDILIADLSGPIDNDGFFDLSGILDSYRSGYSEPCRLKVTGDLGEYGWSDFIDMSLPITEGPLEGMEFVTVPSGSFQMGSPSSESGRDSDERQHRVTVSSFELMTTEVTQGMWEEVMGDNPSHFDNGDDYPVESVSWNDCQAFIEELNDLDSRYTYRLPTEAEWEYACRAGTTTRFYWGDIDSESGMSRYCWYTANSNSSTHPVAQKEPNSWGLYDMSGNVYEWCEDVYTSDYGDCPTDGSAYTGSGSYRVERGGGWNVNARSCRSADRISCSPGSWFNSLGFRLARSVR